MNYLKSVVKNVYQKVIQDEYLQQLTQHEVFSIINNTSRRRLASSSKDPRKLSQSQLQQEIFKKVDQLGNTSPERIFRLLGGQPGIQIVKSKLKQLNQNLEQVSTLMQDNFSKYDKKINQAITVIDNNKNMYTTKKYALQLRTKIHRLEQATAKSKRIMHLHVKANNIKKLLKIISEMPNIKKMTLTQLKTINIQNLKNKSTLGHLKCLSGITVYIQKAVATQLTQVLHILQKCLIDKFEQNFYENALKDFILAQHQTIKYQKLIIKLVQNHIRKIDNQLQSNITQICQFYIRLMINLHGVFRWHRINQKQQKWQNLSKGHFGINIEIDINNITKKITNIMDQCFKDVVLQKFYHLEIDDIAHNLEILYMMCRISQIAYTFSGEYFTQTLKQCTQFLYKKLQKLKQKASHELQQTLKYQQKNNWNRLPVVDSYSHQVVDKALYQIYRHLNSQAYVRVINLLNKSKPMFKQIKIGVSTMGQLAVISLGKDGNLWDSVWEFQQKEKIKQNGSSSLSKIQSNGSKITENTEQSQPQRQQILVETEQQQTWQIQRTTFPFNQKYQKYKSLTSLKPLNPSTHKTIICQYSLTILKYTELFTKYAFYYPIEPVLSFCLSSISLTLEYYIYNIFNGFISYNLKMLFFDKITNLNTLQQKYHKKRLHYTYPIVSKFITQFKTTNKLTIREPSNNQQPSHIKHSHSYSYTNIASALISSPGSSGNININNSQSSSSGGDAGKQNLIVRSRVVALESLKYLIMYYEHIMRISGFYVVDPEGSKSNGGNYNSNYGNVQIGVKIDIQEANRTQISKNHSITSSSSITSIEQTHKITQNISGIHPQLQQKISQKLSLYKQLYHELSQFIYTDCIPKLCKLKDTQSLIQSIKWNDNEQTINQYMQVFSQHCTQFYYKMNANNRGEVPINICDRLFGVFWKTQLTAIMKAFMNCYKPGKYAANSQNSPKHKLQKFIDGLYENIAAVVKQKVYMRIPYQKIKAVFPILMQSSWQSTFQLLKISLNKYQFVYAVEIGLFTTSQSCCYLGNDDLEDRRKIVQNWIQQKLIGTGVDSSKNMYSTPRK